MPGSSRSAGALLEPGTSALQAAPDFVWSAVLEGLEPRTELTVSQWADQYRWLTGKGSTEPGLWRTSRTPYLREIMDCLSPQHPARRVVFQKGAQIGATECGNNWIGYTIHHHPCPMMMVQPSLELARLVSKQRIAPMIEESDVLRDRVLPARSRDSGNTVLNKEYAGGILAIVGANSSKGLRMMPVRNLMLDEVDDYPGEVGAAGKEQGDPRLLAEARTATYEGREKIYIPSTPTTEGVSNVADEFKRTDQRRYVLPCPHCNFEDWIQWRIGGWSGAEGRHHHIYWEGSDHRTAALVCSACDQKIEEDRWKTKMLEAGRWVPTAVSEDPATVGFHLSSLYSPRGWRSWSECVRLFLRAKKQPLKLKVWVNTTLGETWDEGGDKRLTDAGVLSRAREYEAEVPHGVSVLVCAVDVQSDRLEVQVVGFGVGEESWLIAYTVLQGDPGQAAVWGELTRFLRGKFKHASGREVPISCTTVDSGGHHTDTVYRYAKLHEDERVFAIKGGSISGAPITSRFTKHNRFRAKLFTLGVVAAKDLIFARLRVARPGPEFMHLPGWVDEAYVQSLLSEKPVTKYVKGRGAVRTYEVIKGREENHVLDLTVYCLAALYILGPPVMRFLRELAAALSDPLPAPPPAAAAAAPAPAAPARGPHRRGGGYVNAWRKG